jgi:26S proteasome regulatory subunit N2
MTKDPVDYVRQGAFISLAMILMQQNDTTNTKVSSTRKLYEKIINDKHEDAMAKFGAVLGQGIIDAGIYFLIVNNNWKHLISFIIKFKI